MSDQQSTPAAQPLPDQYEAAAHMYPCDLETFKTGEHVISAFSIPVGSPDHGKSVPLWTSEQMDDHARKAVRAEVERLAAMRQGVPEGMVLVPIEPDERDIADAVADACTYVTWDEDTDEGFPLEFAMAFYRSLLAAPSSPPAPSLVPEKEADGHSTAPVPGEASTGVPTDTQLLDMVANKYLDVVTFWGGHGARDVDQAPEATGEPVTVEALHDESGTVYLPVLRLGGVRLYGKERPRLRWAQAVADSVNAEFAPPQRPQGQEPQS